LVFSFCPKDRFPGFFVPGVGVLHTPSALQYDPLCFLFQISVSHIKLPPHILRLSTTQNVFLIRPLRKGSCFFFFFPSFFFFYLEIELTLAFSGFMVVLVSVGWVGLQLRPVYFLFSCFNSFRCSLLKFPFETTLTALPPPPPPFCACRLRLLPRSFFPVRPR